MDRVNALTVVLDKDYREDDIQAMVDAISLFKGVITVKYDVAGPETYIAIQRAKNELRSRILDIILGDR